VAEQAPKVLVCGFNRVRFSGDLGSGRIELSDIHNQATARYASEWIPKRTLKPHTANLCLVCAVTAFGFGTGFVATPPGVFCDKQCFSQGLTSSQFKKIGTQLSTFACGVRDPMLGVVAGYQLSNGTATCSVASATAAKASTDYSCLCQVGDAALYFPVKDTAGFQRFLPFPALKTLQVTLFSAKAGVLKVERFSEFFRPAPGAVALHLIAH